MKKFVLSLSVAALVSVSGAAFAGGLNDSVSDDEVKAAAGPVSSFPIWIPLAAAAGCALACGSNGGTSGTTTGD